ncbi:MAG: hypothetical protein D6756_13680, partial [Cyanobacteria bacterium J083]
KALAAELEKIKQTNQPNGRTNNNNSVQQKSQNPASRSKLISKINQAKLRHELQQTPKSSQVPKSNSLDLNFEPRYLSAPLEVLSQLNGKSLLRELLGRVLSNGIGRLYLEKHKHYGRIIWSQDGTLQGCLEEVDLHTYQGVIDYLKQLANVATTPVEKAIKKDLEACRKAERLILRLQILPGKHGDEGTVQILRGGALEFYEKQRIEKIGEQAIIIASKFEKQLEEMHQRQLQGISSSLETISALEDIQHKINLYINSLKMATKSYPKQE